MEASAVSTDRTTWSDTAATFVEDWMNAVGDDGAPPSGFKYWSKETAYLIQFIESERLEPGKDIEADYYDTTMWFLQEGRYVLHATLLHDAATSMGGDGRRIELGDSDYTDWESPSGFLSRVAGQYAGTSPEAEIVQRFAWDGHNAHFGSGKTRRDEFDILWFDEDVAPTSSLTNVSTHHCFNEAGIVSLRAGWASDDPVFTYHGGQLFGGHDDPDIGGFELWADGHLVGGDGLNTTSKRTTLGSAPLVEGWGQHGDGYGISEAPPEGAGNGSKLVAYLDAKGTVDPDLGGASSIDVVLFGSDLTQLYRVDDADDDRCSGCTDAWVSDADGPDASGRVLEELYRYGVWVGDEAPSNGSGAIFLRDRWATSGSPSFDFQWRLVTSDRNPDGTLPACNLTAYSDFYRYTNGTSTFDVRYKAQIGDDRECPTMPCGVTLEEQNENYWPTGVPTTSSCNGSFISAPSSKVRVVNPGHNSVSGHGDGGRLEVQTLGLVGWQTERPIAGGRGGYDGSGLAGYQIWKQATGATPAGWTHILLPIVDPTSSGTGPAVLTEYTQGISGGAN